MPLIIQLLKNQKSRLTAEQLYTELVKDSKQGGLGKPFRHNGLSLINDAFIINHVDHTVYVRSREHLFLLAQSFRDGENGFKKKPKNYVLLLALLYYVADGGPKDEFYLKAQAGLSAVFLVSKAKLTTIEAEIRNLFLKRIAEDLFAEGKQQERQEVKEMKQLEERRPQLFVTVPDDEIDEAALRIAQQQDKPREEKRAELDDELDINSPVAPLSPTRPLAPLLSLGSESASQTLQTTESPTQPLRPEIVVAITPESSGQSHAESLLEIKSQFSNYIEFLQKMNEIKSVVKSTGQIKAAQVDFFVENIHKLSLQEFFALSEHMMGVQNKTIRNEYFPVIRGDQNGFYRFFNSQGGNTSSWQQLFHILKTSLTRKIYSFNPNLTEKEERTHKVELSPGDYAAYMKIMGFHTNRWYGRWGKTDSERAFDMYFEQNQDLQNGNVRKSEKGIEELEVSCVWNLRS